MHMQNRIMYEMCQKNEKHSVTNNYNYNVSSNATMLHNFDISRELLVIRSVFPMLEND